MEPSKYSQASYESQETLTCFFASSAALDMSNVGVIIMDGADLFHLVKS